MDDIASLMGCLPEQGQTVAQEVESQCNLILCNFSSVQFDMLQLPLLEDSNLHGISWKFYRWVQQTYHDTYKNTTDSCAGYIRAMYGMKHEICSQQ